MLTAKSFHAKNCVWSVEICKRIYKKERKFDFMAEKTVKLEDPANNRMGSAKMLPLILTMALPAMFSMLIQALYNIVDSYFVAQVSPERTDGGLAGVPDSEPVGGIRRGHRCGRELTHFPQTRRARPGGGGQRGDARHYSFRNHVCGLCSFRCDCGASVYGALHAGRGSAQHGHDVPSRL